MSYDQLKQRHLADYQALFRRVDIDLGYTEAAGRFDESVASKTAMIRIWRHCIFSLAAIC